MGFSYTYIFPVQFQHREYRKLHSIRIYIRSVLYVQSAFDIVSEYSKIKKCVTDTVSACTCEKHVFNDVPHKMSRVSNARIRCRDTRSKSYRATS